MSTIGIFFGTDSGSTRLVGGCDIAGYEFRRSKAVVDGRFVGLALDQHLQHLLTDERISAWLDEVLSELMPEHAESQAVAAGG